jgi:hypothetical protein
VAAASLGDGASARLQRDPAKPDRLTVVAASPGAAARYRLRVAAGSSELEASGLLLPVRWDVRVFPWTVDPREDVEAWRREADARGHDARVDELRLVYASGGPSQLELGEVVRGAALPADRFGTIATTRVALPPGRYAVRTRSDDGIRVRVDGETVIDDWTWHAPREHVHELTIEGAVRTVELRVEHFELDGYAVLEVAIEAAD